MLIGGGLGVVPDLVENLVAHIMVNGGFVGAGGDDYLVVCGADVGVNLDGVFVEMEVADVPLARACQKGGVAIPDGTE